MKADQTACAASNDKVEWHAIDWHKVHRNVRRQQVRIVKAVPVVPLRLEKGVIVA